MSKYFTDHKIDATLRRHLARELDGQLGRAERAFQAHVDLVHPAAITAGAGAPVARSQRTRLWLAGVMGTAVAASIAAIWALPVAPPQSGTPLAVATQPSGDTDAAAPVEAPSTVNPRDASANNVPQWEQVERLVNSMTVDRGPVVLGDNTPGRLVRRVALEETEWVDERRGVRVRAVVPREDVQLISLDTY